MNKLFYKSNEYLKNCDNLSLILTELDFAKNGIEFNGLGSFMKFFKTSLFTQPDKAKTNKYTKQYI